jgi:hypothetical protein
MSIPGEYCGGPGPACSAGLAPLPDPADEQVEDAPEGDLDEAGYGPCPPGQEANPPCPRQVGQAEDLPSDYQDYGEDEDKIREHRTYLSRRLGREDEESGDLLVRVERDSGLHVAGLVAQRYIDHGVVADAPDERVVLAEALERADEAGDRG